MRHIRFAAYAAAAIIMIALLGLTGCGGGGKLTNGVSTPWNGSLAGVETLPADEETNITLDSWIKVFWPHDGQAPPRNFSVSLEKEQSPNVWGAVHTVLSSADSEPVNGIWWFQPAGDFSANTWYRIIIRANGESTVYAYFLTGDSYTGSLSLSRSSSAVKSYRPANAAKATGEDALTHDITVAK